MIGSEYNGFNEDTGKFVDSDGNKKETKAAWLLVDSAFTGVNLVLALILILLVPLADSTLYFAAIPFLALAAFGLALIVVHALRKF